MRNHRRIQNGKRVCHRDSVVSAQSRAARFYEITVHIDIKPILGKIDGTAALFLADHIHMSLKNQRLCVFIARRGLLYYNHIARLVLTVFKVMRPREIRQIIADSPGIARTVRNRADFFKIVKHSRGCEV